MKVLISEQEIQNRILDISNSLNKDFKDLNPVFLVTLTGASLFATDLFKRITVPAELEFCKLSSYHGNKSTGDVKIKYFPEPEKLFNRHIIIIEDIVDSGLTMAKMWTLLNTEIKPASITTISLLWKKQFSPNIDLEHVGFEIQNHFVVGYGLDYDGKYRNSPDIRIYSEK